MESYFRRYGYVYGTSSKLDFGEWKYYYVVEFYDWEDALDWLDREEKDFRERELISKGRAESLMKDGAELMGYDREARSLFEIPQEPKTLNLPQRFKVVWGIPEWTK